MPADALRARYLADTVATATPARRIVLLYDRLWLDLQRAQAGADAGDLAARDHLQHAQQIVAELLGSLDLVAWPGGADLASLYGYLLTELIAEAGQSRPGRLALITRIVSDLRGTWQQAEEKLATGDASPHAAVRVG
jgi:flagellar protein FliS